MTTSRDYRPNFPPHVLSIAENAFLDAVLPVRPGVTTSTDELRNQIAAAITAADQARNEPPAETPAPTLPTEPGSVVLATAVGGHRFDPPTLAVRTNDTDSEPWILPATAPHVLDGEWWHKPEDITDWIPARVVRDDDRGPAAALRNIATIQFDVYDEMTDRLDLLRAIAREAHEALDRLDNRTQP